MQLAPLASVSLVHAASIVPAAPAAPVAPRAAGFARPLAPAAVGTPAAIEAAIDGAARISTPIVDFPGIKAGDVFDIVKGSKAGPIGVRGDAVIERFDDDAASFHVKAGRFGFNVDVTVDIVRIDDERVRITSSGTGIPNMTEEGRIVESRTNYAVFEQTSDPSKRTVISHDGNGRIVIDTVIPTLGDAHLELERRS